MLYPTLEWVSILSAQIDELDSVLFIYLLLLLLLLLFLIIVGLKSSLCISLMYFLDKISFFFCLKHFCQLHLFPAAGLYLWLE